MTKQTNHTDKKPNPCKKKAFKRAVKQAKRSKESVRRRLARVKENDPVLPLPRFVDRVNEIAERYLPPGDPADGRVTSEFNRRTVRHYQSRTIIDPPEKEGREARYRYRHVLQAVLTRVLLADGFRVPMIRDMLEEKTNAEYEALLEMGPRKARKMAREHRGEGRERGCRSRESSNERQVFVRLEIEPGIEIHIARDATTPRSRDEGEELREKISIALRAEFQRRRRRDREHRSE
ncbi:MerR family transcriptional regulator [Verrucomicrobiaceae bacterium R5-34]|nr:MerR family transcriptional regulator [Verrucomicrobiaceae bacterium R5-34]